MFVRARVCGRGGQSDRQLKFVRVCLNKHYVTNDESGWGREEEEEENEEEKEQWSFCNKRSDISSSSN